MKNRLHSTLLYPGKNRLKKSLQDQSRRNNLRVDGIKKRSNETWENCKKELDTLFKESLGIEEEVVIERAHRVRTDKSKKDNSPRTIACRI